MALTRTVCGGRFARNLGGMLESFRPDPSTMKLHLHLSILDRRRFHSSKSENADATSESARQQFKRIPVDPNILRHIQAVGVGISPRRRPPRKRPIVDRSKARTTSIPTSLKPLSRPTSFRVPPPFGPDSQPVSIISSLQSLDDVASMSSKRRDGTSLPPEIALAGRSNVGKSTLLNSLLYGNRTSTETAAPSAGGRRRSQADTYKQPKGHKAIVSPRPGETRAITIYQLASKENPPRILRLADLPGYGFAFASLEAAKEYQATMSHYLLHRGSPLKRLLLLIDARHGMKRADFEFLDLLQQQVRAPNKEEAQSKGKMPPIQLVLTKCDLVEQADLARRVVQARDQLSESLTRETSRLPIMMVSARAGPGQKGILELQKELVALVPTPLVRVTDDT